MKSRRSARLVVLDAHNRVLLFQYHGPVPLDPARPDLTAYWATPGGGVEPGETYAQTARASSGKKSASATPSSAPGSGPVTRY